MGGSESDFPTDIALDSAGNADITGNFLGTADFDPGVGISSLTSAGGRDVFVSSLDASGNHVWARSLGGNSEDDANGIALDFAGNIHIAGSFFETVDFDPGFGTAHRTNAGSAGAFTLKLSPDMLFDFSGFVGDIKLVRNGDLLDMFFNGSFTSGSYVLFDQEPLSDIRAVRISDSVGVSNSLTLDYLSGGAFGINGGIHFAAGAATTDSVRFIGQSNEGFTYAPSSATANAGTMRTYGDEVTFTGVESVFVTKTQALEVETQGSADVLTVSPGTGFQNNLATRIAGTSGGTAITPLTLDNVRDLTIETGLFDGVLAQSNDTVTFTAGSYEAQGLKNVFVRTGKGNDTLTVNGPDIGLPVPNGAFWFLGGAGIDRLSASGNTNWDLNDIRLVSAGGGRIQHDDIERATLIGGTGKNHLNASLFSGDVTMNGGSDNDLIRGGSGNDTLIGGAGNDRIYGGLGDDNLQGQDDHDQIWADAGEDILTGGIGNDQLWGGDDNDELSGEAGNDILHGGSGDDSLSGGDNNDQLFGDAGNDIVNGGNHNDKLFGGDGADTLNGDAGDDFLSGGTGDDALAGGAGIDLYDLQGTSNAEDLRLQRVNATSASFRRKPRGLSSILEQDSITMDATDEFLISALGGDDLITIDSLFTQLGSVDGGDGLDVCTGPAAWAKVSC
jgi:Ca2+-binding RTX toxin-like protein